MINLTSFIEFHADRHPDRTAVVYANKQISYGELRNRMLRMAGALRAKGVSQGDVVALFMKNSPAFLEIVFAVSHIGAIALPVNYRLAATEADYILNDAGARLVFVDEEFGSLAASFSPEVMLMGEEAQADCRVLDIVASAEVPAAVAVRPSDTARLMYTSGTTSKPKGVIHSYENVYWKFMDHAMALEITSRDRLLVVGPLYHVGALNLPGIAVLWMGGMLCLHREFDAVAALESIDAYELTCGWMAPVMLNQVLEVEGASRKYNLDTLRWCIGGGEKTPESRIRQFTTVFTNGRFVDGYGLTETCSGDTLMEPGREMEKIGSTGRGLAHVDVAICDEQGNWLPNGETGEICLRGPNVTRGYWNAPEKTAEAFIGEWFRTGDVGYLDNDGFLFITDRVKDMILSGGENMASSEIEEVIYKLRAIREVAVIGVPDSNWGERPAAVAVLKEGASLDIETLRNHCAQYLGKFKVPDRLYLRNEIPRNPSGKVLKRVLRDEYATTGAPE